MAVFASSQSPIRFSCNAKYRHVHGSTTIGRRSVGFAPPAPPPQRPPRELLFEFYVARTHKFYRAELLDRGQWGVEAQIVEAPDDFLCGHRFPDRLQAARWAETVRADLEAGYYETGN